LGNIESFSIYPHLIIDIKGGTMKLEKFKIEGMSCNHCVMAVRKELSKLNVNVKDVQIGYAEIEYDEKNVTRDQIANNISNAGYRVAL
jgi:copper chaperone